MSRMSKKIPDEQREVLNVYARPMKPTNQAGKVDFE